MRHFRPRYRPFHSVRRYEMIVVGVLDFRRIHISFHYFAEARADFHGIYIYNITALASAMMKAHFAYFHRC